jgi:hypothetical protein
MAKAALKVYYFRVLRKETMFNTPLQKSTIAGSLCAAAVSGRPLNFQIGAYGASREAGAFQPVEDGHG